MKKTTQDVARQLDVKKKKLIDTVAARDALHEKIAALEREQGVASANDDAKGLERLEADHEGAVTSRQRLIFTAEALADQVKELEEQLAHAEALERADATKQIVRRANQELGALKTSVTTLLSNLEALRESYTELGRISGNSRSPERDLSTALAAALCVELPDYRSLCGPTNGMRQLQTFDAVHAMFTQRATRASAPGGRSGDDVRESQALIAQGRR